MTLKLSSVDSFIYVHIDLDWEVCTDTPLGHKKKSFRVQPTHIFHFGSCFFFS